MFHAYRKLLRACVTLDLFRKKVAGDGPLVGVERNLTSLQLVGPYLGALAASLLSREAQQDQHCIARVDSLDYLLLIRTRYPIRNTGSLLHHVCDSD